MYTQYFCQILGMAAAKPRHIAGSAPVGSVYEVFGNVTSGDKACLITMDK